MTGRIVVSTGRMMVSALVMGMVSVKAVNELRKSVVDEVDPPDFHVCVNNIAALSAPVKKEFELNLYSCFMRDITKVNVSVYQPFENHL